MPDHEILEWVSAGSKQYMLKLRRKDNGKIEHVIKMRGITLNHHVMEEQGLQYETLKQKVLDFVKNGKPDPMIAKYDHFIRPSVKDGAVYTLPYQKLVRPVVCKGTICPDTFDVHHFGFISKE